MILLMLLLMLLLMFGGTLQVHDRGTCYGPALKQCSSDGQTNQAAKPVPPPGKASLRYRILRDPEQIGPMCSGTQNPAPSHPEAPVAAIPLQSFMWGQAEACPEPSATADGVLPGTARRRCRREASTAPAPGH